MKYLTPKIVKLLVIILSVLNLFIAYTSHQSGLELFKILYYFLIFELVVFLLYMIYVTNVRWINESISDLKYRLNIINERFNKSSEQAKIEWDKIAKSLEESKTQSTDKLTVITGGLDILKKHIIGIQEVSYVLSQDNEVLKSKLIEIINVYDNVFNELKALSGLLEAVPDLPQFIKTELTSSVNEVQKLNDNAYNEIVKNLKEQSINTVDEIKTGLTSSVNEVQKLNDNAYNEIVKNFKEQSYYTYNRIDALFSIYQLIKIRSPLPIMHDWAISSDYAHILLQTILKKGKGSVIDLGSGTSSLLLGYAVEMNGSGQVISLEHDRSYMEKTKELIKEHGLEEFIDLHYCPLIEYKIGEEVWEWYDVKNIDFPDDICLISVDGPPGGTQHMARYPAVPLLKNFLTKSTTILLDDAKRDEEAKIAERWLREFKLSETLIKTHKGTFIFNLEGYVI